MVPDREYSGGGAGGGTGMDESGNVLQSADATYQIAGNQVVLLSRTSLPLGVAGPSAKPHSSVITIVAAGSFPTFGDDGRVDVRGAKGVRITAGPPDSWIPDLPPLGPPTSSASTNGIEAIAGEAQNVTIQRGLQPKKNQIIEMTPTGITVDAGPGADSIESQTSIKLSVASVSTISMDPTSITIQGAAGQSIKLSNEGIVLSYGQASLSVTPTGIKMKDGNSSLTLDSTGIDILSGASSIQVNASPSSIRISSPQVFIN